MKTITNLEREQIKAARNEGLTDLHPRIIEKDLLLSDVLATIANTDAGALKLVFCGGTSLSKGYGVIDRMSEDIDFKIETPLGLSRNGRSKLLSNLKNNIVASLRESGFEIPPEKVVARAENNYFRMELEYGSDFSLLDSLRPVIQIDFNANAPLLPTSKQSISSILNGLVQKARGQATAEPMCTIDCISLEETIAEKVVSFLRRTAQAQAGRNRGAYDKRLVRHLYDVHAITAKFPNIELPYERFASLVISDGKQFRNQYPEFETEPIGPMRMVLDSLRNNSESFESAYKDFVSKLVFGNPVSYQQASNAFVSAAEALVDHVESMNECDPYQPERPTH